MAAPTRFENLESWREAHSLVLTIYQASQVIPDSERFGLISQMRRSAVSMPANIAEGFKRRGLADKIRFYNTAEGSLEELKYYLILSRDLGYLADNSELRVHADTVGRLLNGLIESTEHLK